MSVVILASICNEVDLRILFRGLSVQWITKLKLQVSSELSVQLEFHSFSFAQDCKLLVCNISTAHILCFGYRSWLSGT
jgi:hypothetical protein